MTPAYTHLACLLAVLLAHSAIAVPIDSPNSLSSRASAPFDGPKTIQTHHVITVPGGSVVEDCAVTLTPVVVNGLNVVNEVRHCQNVFVQEGDPLPPPPAGTPNPPAPPPAHTPPPPGGDKPPPGGDKPPPGGDKPPAGGDDKPPTDPHAPPPKDPSPSPPDTPGNSDPDTPLTPGDPDAGGDAPANGGTPTDPGAGGDTANGGTAPGSGSPPADPAIDLGATNVPASSPQGQNGGPAESNVAIPGKKLEVLPIGLGVFAGISVIALIVVGLVTYERTKYRKAFRQRRLAATGADMGYGGMSERR